MSAQAQQPVPQAARQPAANDPIDLAPVKSFDELWYLLTAMDSLIFLLTTAVLKDDHLVFESVREFQPYSTQLGDPKGVSTFNAALNSAEGKARATANSAAIAEAAKEIDGLLGDIVSEGVRTSLVRAFARTSALLVAHDGADRNWWCRVYAFRKVRC